MPSGGLVRKRLGQPHHYISVCLITVDGNAIYNFFAVKISAVMLTALMYA